MDDGLGLEARQDSGGELGRGEGRVDEGQHLGRRAPGGQQVDPLEAEAGAGGALAVEFELLDQQLGPRALEGVDRLLLVADHEHVALEQALGGLAGSGEELLGQGADDFPLLGSGVLGFVNEDMINPAVELVEHPGGHGARGDQIACLFNEIGEVERA